MKRIYLAGPDVFRHDPFEHFEKLKYLSKKYGFIGLSPFDNEDNFDGELYSKKHSTHVFLSNVELLKNCDIIIANLITFRGVCIDDGTAFEIGCGYANNKTLYGYTNNFNMKLNLLTKTTHAEQFLKQQAIFPGVESFGENCVNLMIQESIELSGGKILRTFEDCLIDLNKKHNL